MNAKPTWQLVPAAPTQDWTNAFGARGPRIGTFDKTIRDVLATAPAPDVDVVQELQAVRAALAFLPAGDTAVAGLDRVIGALGRTADAASGAAGSTEARTGNTAEHQAAWFAGIEQGQTNAQINAGIGAQQLQERADKVVIAKATGNETMFLAAVKDLLAAVRTFRPAPAAGDARALPELNDDLIGILGRPNFACTHIAQLLRRSGVEIDKKAEAEQATVIHYLLGFYLKHGSQWVEKAGEDLERLRLAALAAQQGKGGEA